MTEQERILFRERLKNFTTRSRVKQALNQRSMIVVRIEKTGHHRQTVVVTREDFDIAIGQLTLLKQL